MRQPRIRHVPRERDIAVLKALAMLRRGYSMSVAARIADESQTRSIQSACYAVREDDILYSTMPGPDGKRIETEKQVRKAYW